MAAFDVDAVSWILPRLSGGFGAVTRHVPDGFERYARVFHPADPGLSESTTWAAVAHDSGTVMHPTAQFEALARASRVQPPQLGNLAVEQLRALTTVLRRHTTTPEDCFLAFWEGWGDSVVLVAYAEGGPDVSSERPQVKRATPPAVGRFALPGRMYEIFRGDVDLADQFGDQVSEDWLIVQSPNLLWPADRSWFVATEVDFDSTLVGGSGHLIEELVGSTALEVAEVRPDDELHDEADTINV